MKLSNFLAILQLGVVQAVASRCSVTPPSSNNDTVPEVPGVPSVPDGCCCMSYKSACTMNLERAFHIKLFYNRKEGITPEEFNQYWAYNHSAIATPFHLRMGVLKYNQFHSTPEIRNLVAVEGGLPILEFDGGAEFWVHQLETFAAMGSDPYYLNTIMPDEENFIDMASKKVVVGVDYIVVENQNAVEEHGRVF